MASAVNRKMAHRGRANVLPEIGTAYVPVYGLIRPFNETCGRQSAGIMMHTKRVRFDESGRRKFLPGRPVHQPSN
jgi:hypothetical protein